MNNINDILLQISKDEIKKNVSIGAGVGAALGLAKGNVVTNTLVGAGIGAGLGWLLSEFTENNSEEQTSIESEK